MSHSDRSFDPGKPMKKLLLLCLLSSFALADDFDWQKQQEIDALNRQADAAEMQAMYAQSNSLHSAGTGCRWAALTNENEEHLYFFVHGLYRQAYVKECSEDPKEVPQHQHATRFMCHGDGQ